MFGINKTVEYFRTELQRKKHSERNLWVPSFDQYWVQHKQNWMVPHQTWPAELTGTEWKKHILNAKQICYNVVTTYSDDQIKRLWNQNITL